MLEEKVKNLKINKKLIYVLASSTLALNLACQVNVFGEVAKADSSFEEDQYTMQNNYVETNSLVNMRADNSLSGEIICKVKANQELRRILSQGNWDLVVYKDKIGFVCGDYVDDSSKTDENLDDLQVSLETGYVSANTGINLRLGPSTDDKVIGSMKESELAEVMGRANDDWYLVSYNGQIGFVSSDFVEYKENINFNGSNEEKLYIYSKENVNFRDEPTEHSKKISLINKDEKMEVLSQEDNGWYKVLYNGETGYVCADYLSFNPSGEYRSDFIKVVYASSDVELKDIKGEGAESFYTISKNETCEVLAEYDDSYFVRTFDRIGYVPKENMTNLHNTFVVIDISSQKLTIYRNNEILLETDVVTGKKGVHDTPIGIYSIAKKTTDTFLSGDDYYQHVDYWMPFNGNIGLHDATWRNSFGGEIYEKKGSHGCVNVPPQYADDVYDNVEKGTRVIVQK